jgi:hypothetical protein
VQHVVDHLVPTKENDNLEMRLDFEDEIIGASIAVHGGEVRHAPTAAVLQPANA